MYRIFVLIFLTFAVASEIYADNEQKLLKFKNDVQEIGVGVENLAFDILGEFVKGGDMEDDYEGNSIEKSMESTTINRHKLVPEHIFNKLMKAKTGMAKSRHRRALRAGPPRVINVEAPTPDAAVENKCDQKTEEEKILERQHIEDLKEEVKKLHDLVTVLKDQQKIVSLLDRDAKSVDNDLPDNFKELPKALDGVKTNEVNDKGIENNSTSTDMARLNDSETKATHEELDRIKHDLRQTILALNTTRDILALERDKEVSLENELHHQQIELNLLKVMVDSLYNNHSIFMPRSNLENSEIPPSGEVVGAARHVPKDPPSEKNRNGTRESAVGENRRRQLQFSQNHRIRASELDELSKLISEMNKPKPTNLESRILEIQSEIEKRNKEEESRRMLQRLLDQKESKSQDADTIRQLQLAVKLLNRPQSKSDEVDEELRKLQVSINSLRPKQEFDLDSALLNNLNGGISENKQQPPSLTPQQIADLRKQLAQMSQVTPSTAMLPASSDFEFGSQSMDFNRRGPVPYPALAGSFGNVPLNFDPYNRGMSSFGYIGPQHAATSLPTSFYQNNNYGAYGENSYDAPRPFGGVSTGDYSAPFGPGLYGPNSGSYGGSLGPNSYRGGPNTGSYGGPIAPNSASYGGSLGPSSGAYGGPLVPNSGSYGGPLGPNSGVYGGPLGPNSGPYGGPINPNSGSYGGNQNPGEYDKAFGGNQGQNDYNNKPPLPYSQSSSNGPSYNSNDGSGQFFQGSGPNSYEKAGQNGVYAAENGVGNGGGQSGSYLPKNTNTIDYKTKNIEELKTQVNTLQNVINGFNYPDYSKKPEDQATVANLEQQIGELKGVINSLSQEPSYNQSPPNYDANLPPPPAPNYEKPRSRSKRSVDNPERAADDKLYDQVASKLKQYLFESEPQEENNYQEVQNRIADLKSQLARHLDGNNYRQQRHFEMPTSSGYDYQTPNNYQTPSYQQAPNYQQTAKTFDLLKPKFDLLKPKEDLFTAIVLKIIDKIIRATPAVLQKLLGYGIYELTNFQDDGYGKDNGYGAVYGGKNDLKSMFKSLGFFGFVPLLILKIIDGFTTFVNILKKNKFFKNFLIPALILGLVAGSVIFLVWFLQPTEDYSYQKIGYGGQEYGYSNNGYQNYNKDVSYSNQNNYNNGYDRSRINPPVYYRSYFENNGPNANNYV